MARGLSLACFAALFAAVAAAGAARPADPPQALQPIAAAPVAAPETDIGPLLDALRLKHHQPAMAAAVIQGGAIVASAAVGVRKAGEDDPVGLDDRFHIGSCTKSMTSTLIGMLVDEGRLRWDTTIIEAFPDLKEGANAKFAHVTLEQLLTHRAGVPQFTAGSAPEFAMVRGLTGTPREQRRAFVAAVMGSEPVAEPGTKMIYSNGGYGIAAAIAEQAADAPWETLIEERIFKPLGMTTAGLGWPASADHPREPWGHWKGMTTPDQPTPAPTPHDPAGTYQLAPALAPAGNVNCSVNDFARFALFHLRGLQGAESRLSPATFRRLHTPILNDCAMGWVVRTRPDGSEVSWHNGSAGTFFTWMTVWPRGDLAVVVMANCGDGEPACREATDVLQKRFTAPAGP